MLQIWDRYPRLFGAIQRAHEERKIQQGHNFEHAFAVAQRAREFCECPFWIDNAWLAGTSHNADRMLQGDLGIDRRGDVPAEKIERLVRSWLDLESRINEDDKAWVVRAVLDHGKPNDDDDSAVTVALKDADRVVNARIDIVLRSAQWQHDLPLIDPVLLLDDKRGRYNGRLTVVADLFDCLDWGSENPRLCVRTPKARKMIKSRVDDLRRFLEMLVEQRREEGLVPWPLQTPV